MDLILKTVVAFVVGIGSLAAAQQFWLSSFATRLQTQMANGPSLQSQIRPLPKFDTGRLRLTIPTVDPALIREGQRLAVLSAARQVEMHIRNVQRSVPMPGSFPGMRR